MDHNTWEYLKTIGNKLRDGLLCYANRNNSDKKNVMIFKYFHAMGFWKLYRPIVYFLDTYLLYFRCYMPLNKINHNSLKNPL